MALEACHRRIERDAATGASSRADHTRALIAAAGAFAPAILTSLVITALSFLPVFAFTGETGRLLRPLALTKTLVIAASAIVTLTVAPALRARLVTGGRAEDAQATAQPKAIFARNSAAAIRVDHHQRSLSLRGIGMFRNIPALLFVTACTSGASSTGISELSCPPGSTLNYANFAQDVISTHCLSCHDNRSPRLMTQAAVKAESSQILDAAVYTDAMPGSGSMTLDERKLLGEWLVCGAP